MASFDREPCEDPTGRVGLQDLDVGKLGPARMCV